MRRSGIDLVQGSRAAAGRRQRLAAGALTGSSGGERAARRLPALAAAALMAAAWAGAWAGAAPLPAQVPMRAPPPADTGGIGFHAIGLVTDARPAMEGETQRERYLTQPLLILHDPGPRLSSQLVLNFEAWTLAGGELNAGTWGEGYVDRRHPHTFLHELVMSAQGESGPLDVTLTGGRGFVPFGSDDPMARPFVKYPSNHHLAHVLERWIVVGAARLGRLALEMAAFNGDEPTGPRSTGRRSRFGDSYAARVTLWPVDALELQASRALVASPEHVDGGGLDHRKWHASARLAAEAWGVPAYVLAEWGRTDEHDGERRAFSFGTGLVEVAVDPGPLRLAARWERTTRPEEERLDDPFRSARPHADANIIGVTRWEGAALHVALGAPWGDARLSPFLEVARLGVREITGGLFDPVEFYGGDVHWSLSAGVRFSAGLRHVRAGRYGVALRGPAHAAGGHHE